MARLNVVLPHQRHLAKNLHGAGVYEVITKSGGVLAHLPLDNGPCLDPLIASHCFTLQLAVKPALRLPPATKQNFFGVVGEKDHKADDHWDGDSAKQPFLFSSDILKIDHVPAKKDGEITPLDLAGQTQNGLVWANLTHRVATRSDKSNTPGTDADHRRHISGRNP